MTSRTVQTFYNPRMSMAEAHPPSGYDCQPLLTKFRIASPLIESALDLDKLLEHVVDDIAETVGSIEVSVWLREESTGRIVLLGVRGCSQYKKGQCLNAGRALVASAAASGEIRYAPDVWQESLYVACEPATRSELCIPLLVNNRTIGVLCIDHRKIDAFPREQIEVLVSLAGHLALVIENAQRFRRECSERRRLQKESVAARELQESMFLNSAPVVPGFTFETVWHPAGVLAGDWFDFIELGQNRYGIALGDVSGKGTSAALLMTSTRALLRSIAPIHTDPAQLLEHLGRMIADDFPHGRFVTMLYAVLDISSRQLSIASAGHPLPLLIEGDACFIELEAGLPLGMGRTSYPQESITLTPGRNLLLYTDGIIEAANRVNEEFGVGRLLRHFGEQNASLDGLMRRLQIFSGSPHKSDDSTAVLIRSHLT
jgi:sigma-B regulation protein RsbU (phosphoserine phosphatase)